MACMHLEYLCVRYNVNLKDTSIIKPNWNNRLYISKWFAQKEFQGLEVLE